jgi:hypothetical protein
VWLASSLAGLSCHTSGGRNFLAGRTSVDVTEAPICGAAVVDHDECRPGSYGGNDWQKDSSFPPYTVSEYAVRRGVQHVIAEVRQHYLGSPYYDGDVHSFCKKGLDTDLFPADSTSMQEYELAKVIEDRAVRPLESRLRVLIESRDPRESDAVTTRFHESLMEEVRDRVQARFIWFVARYPGGLSDISRNERLRRCIQELRSNSGSEMITGVAGYIVLDNRIDNEISSEAVVYRAIERATTGRYRDVVVDTDYKRAMGAEWQRKVSDVANIKMARQDITAVAWPLWVQFE